MDELQNVNNGKYNKRKIVDVEHYLKSKKNRLKREIREELYRDSLDDLERRRVRIGKTNQARWKNHRKNDDKLATTSYKNESRNSKLIWYALAVIIIFMSSIFGLLYYFLNSSVDSFDQINNQVNKAIQSVDGNEAEKLARSLERPSAETMLIGKQIEESLSKQVNSPYMFNVYQDIPASLKTETLMKRKDFNASMVYNKDKFCNYVEKVFIAYSAATGEPLTFQSNEPEYKAFTNQLDCNKISLYNNNNLYLIYDFIYSYFINTSPKLIKKVVLVINSVKLSQMKDYFNIVEDLPQVLSSIDKLNKDNFIEFIQDPSNKDFFCNYAVKFNRLYVVEMGVNIEDMALDPCDPLSTVDQDYTYYEKIYEIANYGKVTPSNADYLTPEMRDKINKLRSSKLPNS
jgi:hypothetical protein